MTALHTAAYNGHPDCVRALLDAGINQGLKAADGRLALDMCHDHANSANNHRLTLEAFKGHSPPLRHYLSVSVTVVNIHLFTSTS